MIGTRTEPAVSPAIVKANPDQGIPHSWRWGPRWELGGRMGVWVVDRIYHVAVRLEDDETEPLKDIDDIDDELEEARDAQEDAIADGKLEQWVRSEAQRERFVQRRRDRAARLRLRRAVREGRLGGPDDGAAAAAVPA